MSIPFRPLIPLAAVVSVHMTALALFLTDHTEQRPLQKPVPLLTTLLAPEPAPQPKLATPSKPVRQTELAKPHVPRPQAAVAINRPLPARRPVATASNQVGPVAEPVSPPMSTAAPAAAPATAPTEEPSVDASLAGNERPRYPSISRQLGEQGTVILSVYVRADGSVGDVRLKKSSQHERLDQAALDKVRQWHFTPAMRAGVAVDRWYDLPIRFQLNSPQH